MHGCSPRLDVMKRFRRTAESTATGSCVDLWRIRARRVTIRQLPRVRKGNSGPRAGQAVRQDLSARDLLDGYVTR